MLSCSTFTLELRKKRCVIKKKGAFCLRELSGVVCNTPHLESSNVDINRIKAYHSQIIQTWIFYPEMCFNTPALDAGRKPASFSWDFHEIYCVEIYIHKHTHVFYMCIRMHTYERTWLPHPQILQHYMKQMSFSPAAHRVLHCLVNANGGHLPVKAYSSTMAHATIETVLLHLRPRQSCMCPD